LTPPSTACSVSVSRSSGNTHLVDSMAEEYPTTFEQFLEWFGTEEDCAAYIRAVRWPDGFACPKCKGRDTWSTKRLHMRCTACGHDTSVTAGTVFEDTRKPLRLWFHVMWFMVAQKTGVSAKNLKESLGFGSYQTIWGWLHKFRSVMVRPGRERLCGTVEVDETYIGGEAKGKRGRGAEKKTLVVVAVEGKDENLGRVRFRCVPDASADSLIPFIADNVEPGSEVITDGWAAYASIPSNGYVHRPRTKAKAKETGEDLLCHVHLVVTLLKRWLRGTHQGAVGAEHLEDYLNEFAFRFNRRLSTYRGKLFHRLMQQAVSTRPPGIKAFYRGTHRNP